MKKFVIAVAMFVTVIFNQLLFASSIPSSDLIRVGESETIFRYDGTSSDSQKVAHTTVAFVVTVVLWAVIRKLMDPHPASLNTDSEELQKEYLKYQYEKLG